MKKQFLSPYKHIEKLSDGQIESLQYVWDRIASGDPRARVSLTGAAGAGKTAAIFSLVKEYIEENKMQSIAIVAQTNKAVSVLFEAATHAGLVENNQPVPQVKFSTVAGILGLRPREVKDKKVFKLSEHCPITNFDLVIIDEASMLNESLVDLIVEYSNTYRFKVIFMGDKYQLPPVGESNSTAFDNIPDHTNIAGIQRYDGNVLKWATDIRNVIEANEAAVKDAEARGLKTRPTAKRYDCKNFIGLNETDIWHVRDEDLIVEPYLEAYRKGLGVKYLAFTNATVDAFNDKIHRKIHGADADRYIPGELLVSLDTFSTRGKVILRNEEVVRILKVVRINMDVTKNVLPLLPPTSVPDEEQFELPSYAITIQSAYDANGELIPPPVDLKDPQAVDNYVNDPMNDTITVYVPQEGDGQEAFEEILEGLRTHGFKRNEWHYFHNFNNRFVALRYIFATTIHKSQGSTYDMSFVNVGEISTKERVNQTMNRMLYTALTRSANVCVIY